MQSSPKRIKMSAMYYYRINNHISFSILRCFSRVSHNSKRITLRTHRKGV